MGRCGGWIGKVAVTLAFVVASCGGTGGGPSDSGKPLVFQARGRLNLIAQPTNDARVLTLIATLLDPQGVPFRNQRVTFTAEFADATFIPGNDNQGSALTNDAGQARITLVAGLTTGQMRVTAEAPPALNISTAITVEITAQGFVSRGVLGIIPSSVTFVNPLVGPNVSGPMTIFNATGGTPPYRWNNSNKSLGRIVPIGIRNVNEQAEYTLIGPIPTEVGEALQDTVTLQDAAGDRATATVLAIFAECTLTVSPTTPINFPNALGGETAQITVTNGVPPFTVTQSRPEAGRVIEQSPGIFVFTVATPPVPIPGNSPNTILIRDSRGCIASVDVVITVGNLVITPESVILSPGQKQQFVLVGGVPPYRITPNGGTVDAVTLNEAGGSFRYTAGAAEGTFSIIVTDARNAVVQATVTIQVADLLVQPDNILFCDAAGLTARITILSGVPPFRATHTFNDAGELSCEGETGPEKTGDVVLCDENRILYEVTTTGVFDPDSVVIRDSEGRRATVSVVINGEACA